MSAAIAPDPSFDLRGRVAVVTGSSSGIGLAIAKALARHGATVVVSGNDVEGCERAAAQLRADGHAAAALPCEVGSRESVQGLARTAHDSFGRVDVLVCNAGMQGPFGPITEASDAAWDEVMTVDLRSMVWLATEILPGMAERGGGSVILVSSIAGVRGNKSIGVYSVAKAGVAALARNLAVEWGPANVRVNAISPGLIRTPFSHSMMNNAAVMERRLGLTPLRRVGEPQEVAGLAVLLAAPAGAFITGQNLIVDGGTTIGDGN